MATSKRHSTLVPLIFILSFDSTVVSVLRTIMGILRDELTPHSNTCTVSSA